MLESFGKNNKFTYQKITEEEKAQRGILGRLVGILADTKKPTRNGRLYSADLWNKVFDNDIMKEKIANRCCFGELGHPADRTEIDMEKIAVCLAETPKVGDDGLIYGVFDILSTPNGKILKSLCDYGCNIGISSRGQGDIISGVDGDEVDPETYDCQCWDAVLIPAVKEARLSLVTESLSRKKKTLKENLNKVIESANDNERKVMLETLDSIGVDIVEKQEDMTHIRTVVKSLSDKLLGNGALNDEEKKLFDAIKKCYNQEDCADKLVQDESKAVENNEAKVIEELQETLKQKQELEQKVTELQEKLSVCYAKEAEMQESINHSKKVITRLSLDSKKAKALEEKVSKLSSVNEELNKQLGGSALVVKKLNESVSANKAKSFGLTEQLKTKDSEITKLTESITKIKEEFGNERESLNESIAELKKDLQLKKSEYSSKIEKSNKLVEKYNRIANIAVDKYIDSQALKMGVTSEEIKNKLPNNYSFDDIDSICEDLQNYRLTVDRLPFQSNLMEGMRMKATTPQKGLIPANSSDVVDDSLLRLAGMK